MSYIGTPPSNAFTSLLKQDFSTSATTGYTLDHAVNNANDIALFINFVRQEPTAGYAASGTSLVLTSATASSDDMYCVYLGQALQTVNPPNASVGLSQLSATGTKNSTTFLRGDNTFASAGGDNTPYFYAYRNGNTNISADTWTVVAFNAETLDSGNGFNTSTGIYTVPSGQGGKYYLEHAVEIEASTSQVDRLLSYGETSGGSTQYWGNGVIDFRGNPGLGGTVNGSAILTLAAGDTVKVNIYADLNTGTPTLMGSNERPTYFLGYKIIE